MEDRVRSWGLWLAAIAVVAAVGAGAYAYFVLYGQSGPGLDLSRSRSPAGLSPTPVQPPASGSVPNPRELAVEHPLPGEPAEASMQAPAQSPADAIAAFQAELAGLVDPQRLGRYVEVESLPRRVVSTVDNVSSDELPLRARLILPIRGPMVVTGSGDALAIDPANARRYEPLVALFEAIDTRRAVDLYIRHYRIFQGEYRAQGSPNRYFNDRMVAAIDHLLATPEVRGPIRLVQPKVLYRFADPELEALSASQKAMLRIGPENAARIKAKLRAVRAEIARQTGPRRQPDPR
jgi:hypothetical protein